MIIIIKNCVFSISKNLLYVNIYLTYTKKIYTVNSLIEVLCKTIKITYYECRQKRKTIKKSEVC